MDFSKYFDLNTATDNKLFDPTFLNLDFIFYKILTFFRTLFSLTFSPEVILIIKIAMAALSIFFVIMITYCIVRLFEIREKEEEHLHHEIAEYAHKQAERAKKLKGENGQVRNGRWENVLNYLSSQNESEWKLAIIEADSMLEDLTEQLGLEGENLGERLKTANRDRFKTLNDAWEAHIVRNRIAHEGSKFDLTLREANRVAVLYENVFREFGII